MTRSLHASLQRKPSSLADWEYSKMISTFLPYLTLSLREKDSLARKRSVPPHLISNAHSFVKA
jgi:hypothetical protein